MKLQVNISNRVVRYSMDEDLDKTLNSTIVDYNGIIPNEFNTSNCHNYVYLKTVNKLIPLTTQDQAEKSLLALEAKRQDLYAMLAFNVNSIRSVLGKTGYLFQDAVYSLKLQDALEFAKTGYNEAKIDQFPFISFYATKASLSNKQAAETIIEKAKIYKQILAQTEDYRQRYEEYIEEAQTEARMEAVKASMVETIDKLSTEIANVYA